MDPFSYNPFTVFTLIAAPAVLTNASAVMSLTTSNRLARAIDRVRSLQVECGQAGADEASRHIIAGKIEATRRRSLLLVRALGSFQLAYGSFSAATLVALVGSGLKLAELNLLSHVALLVAMACFCVAILATMLGAAQLVRETRLAYTIVREDAQRVLESIQTDAVGREPPASAQVASSPEVRH